MKSSALSKDGQAANVSNAARQLLDHLAHMLAQVVLRSIHDEGRLAHRPRYYTASTSPLPAKTFRAAAREGRFPSYRVGKRVYALCDEVHRFMEAQERPLKSTRTTSDDDEIGRLLDGAHIRSRRGR